MTTFCQNFSKVVTTTLSEEDQQIKIDGQSKWQNTKNGHGRVSKKPRFQDNNAIKVKYTMTGIKSRNFLSNIAGMYA